MVFSQVNAIKERQKTKTQREEDRKPSKDGGIILNEQIYNFVNLFVICKLNCSLIFAKFTLYYTDNEK